MGDRSSILIKNIYYMLSYAFQNLRRKDFEEVEKEEFDHILNMFAAILSKETGRLLKQGLHREYTDVFESAPVLRGKINITESIPERIRKRHRMACGYAELSENNLYNRILKKGSLLLLKSADVKPEYKERLKRNLLYFENVETVDPRLVRWSSLVFQRNNQNYRMLMGICQLMMEGMLLSTQKGEHRLASFMDDQRMHRLFESFVREYYRKEFPHLHARAEDVFWALDTEESTHLPRMKTDITLHDECETLIIDTKYYSHSMQLHYDSPSVHSAHLYQIFAYVKNKQLEELAKPKNVSGMLLYAKTDAKIQPDACYMMSGNRISVKTLDLNKEFREIALQLDRIVDEHFSSVCSSV